MLIKYVCLVFGYNTTPCDKCCNFTAFDDWNFKAMKTDIFSQLRKESFFGFRLVRSTFFLNVHKFEMKGY